MVLEKVGADGLKEIADRVSASHLDFADKVSASHLGFADKMASTLNTQIGNFVDAFSLLGVGVLLLGALKLYSDRNPPNSPHPSRR